MAGGVGLAIFLKHGAKKAKCKEKMEQIRQNLVASYDMLGLILMQLEIATKVIKEMARKKSQDVAFAGLFIARLLVALLIRLLPSIRPRRNDC